MAVSAFTHIVHKIRPTLIFLTHFDSQMHATSHSLSLRNDVHLNQQVCPLPNHGHTSQHLQVYNYLIRSMGTECTKLLLSEAMRTQATLISTNTEALLMTNQVILFVSSAFFDAKSKSLHV